MSELLLDSLEIKGYRCFEHLMIEKFGQVNLIVGKNNVGKTALLEALWIYAEGSSWSRILDALNVILERRNEKAIRSEAISGSKSGQITFFEKDDDTGSEFRHLFFNRPSRDVNVFSIDSRRIPIEHAPGLRLDATYAVGVKFHGNNGNSVVEPEDSYAKDFHDKIKTLFVKSEGLSIKFLTEIWDDVILRNEEDEAVEALKIISSKIIDLNFINYPKGSNSRVPVVRVEGIDERIPLSSLGEGMNRLLGIALALINCKNGILLIDEVEIGLHYSIQSNIWKLIFKSARHLNVQVFATTHSKDCIEAFAQAAEESPEDGMLIRLERQGENIVAKTITEKRLELAMNHDVEVR